MDDSKSSSVASLPTDGAKGGSYFASDSLRLILLSAATRDLHAVQGVSRQFKKLAQEELQSRSGLIYRITGDALISQIRICFDEKKQVALEVKSNSKKYKLPMMLPIKDKKIIHSNNTFVLSDNPLHIQSITASNVYKTDMQVDFSNSKRSISLKFSPAPEATSFQPTEMEVKLIDAINANNIPTVTDLLKAKVSPNTRDREGVPMLALAASYGDLENVKLLVTHGANLEARSAKGAGQLTPVLIAARYIKDKKEEKKEDKKEEKTPVIQHEYKQKQVMRYLIAKGARVDAQAYTGKTILHYLSRVEMDNTKEIEFLLSRGVDPTQIDLYDRRPTDYASYPKSLVGKNIEVLYVATIHTTPALYCSHWSCLEEGSAYSVHFKPEVWSNKKFRAMDAFASKVKSVKTDDPVTGEIGLANQGIHFEFLDFQENHVSDLPVPKCLHYAALSIRYEEEENCITLRLHERYKNNEFVRRAIEKMFLELKLSSNVELTTVLAEEKKPDSVYTSQLTKFKPAPSSSSSEERTCCLVRNKKSCKRLPNI